MVGLRAEGEMREAREEWDEQRAKQTVKSTHPVPSALLLLRDTIHSRENAIFLCLSILSMTEREKKKLQSCDSLSLAIFHSFSVCLACLVVSRFCHDCQPFLLACTPRCTAGAALFAQTATATEKDVVSSSCTT